MKDFFLRNHLNFRICFKIIYHQLCGEVTFEWIIPKTFDLKIRMENLGRCCNTERFSRFISFPWSSIGKWRLFEWEEKKIEEEKLIISSNFQLTNSANLQWFINFCHIYSFPCIARTVKLFFMSQRFISSFFYRNQILNLSVLSRIFLLLLEFSLETSSIHSINMYISLNSP